MRNPIISIKSGLHAREFARNALMRLAHGSIDMSFTQVSNRAAKQESSGAKARIAAKALRRGLEIDKVTALAILAASAIFAPVAVVILNQAAKIFAH